MKPPEGKAEFLTLIHTCFCILFIYWITIAIYIYLLINELLGTAAHTSRTDTLSEQSVLLVAGLLQSLTRCINTSNGPAVYLYRYR